MPSFEKLFAASNGQPAEYDGDVLFLADTLLVSGRCKIQVRLISADSEWTQAIQFRVNKGGYLKCAGVKSSVLLLREDTMPTETEIEVFAKDGKIIVSNAWIIKDQLGRDVVHAWHNGAAMKKNTYDGIIRYYCCDGHPDGSFKNLVFEVRIIE